MQLLLFDIDGTLTHSAGAGSRAIYQAIGELFGLDECRRRVSMAGKTDPQIYRQILRLNRLKGSRQKYADFLRLYPRRLRTLMKTATGARPHAGVPQLLCRLRERPEFLLGLLTGNLRETARIKLGIFRLNRFFRVGAYGSDHADRLLLTAVAVRRARALGWLFRPAQVVVIGDTPRDIACARSYGARSVAVATGPYRLAQLRRHRPDLLLRDLRDGQRFIEEVRAWDEVGHGVHRGNPKKL